MQKFLLTFLLSNIIVLAFAQNVGINTNDPSETLDVNGKIRLREGGANGHVLQSDSLGVGTWVLPAQSRRRQMCVTDFGAIGDGSTDDTEAFQAAIDSVATWGGKLCVPVGRYKITQPLEVPTGVLIEGDGLGRDFLQSNVSGSVIQYHGTGWAVTVRGFHSGLRDLVILDRSNLEATRAEGGVRLLADQGGPLTGNNQFFHLLITHFSVGTALQLRATNNSGIAYASFYDINIRHGKTGIHIVEDAGSFVNSNSFFQGVFSGGGYDYGLHIQGGNNNTFYGTIFEAAQTSYGHIVVEKGWVRCNDIRLEAASQNPQIPLIDLQEGTEGSHIRGLYSGGVIVNKGSNFVEMVSGRAVGLREAGYNQYENSAFKGVENNVIPHWEIGGSGYRVEVLAPQFKGGHNVLKFRIAAGQSVYLKPNVTDLPDVLNHPDCMFGAYIKTDRSNSVYTRINGYNSSTNTCPVTVSSFHLGNDDWNFTSMFGRTNDVCTVDPRFVFDNSGYGDSATVYITTPTFVFGHTQPSLDAAALSTSGGKMHGTLTTNMITVSSPASNRLVLPHDANLFEITGTNLIQRINDVSVDRFAKGTVITLLFQDAGLSVSNGAYLLLKGSYTSTAYSTLQLVSLGNGTWREIGRNL